MPGLMTQFTELFGFFMMETHLHISQLCLQLQQPFVTDGFVLGGISMYLHPVQADLAQFQYITATITDGMHLLLSDKLLGYSEVPIDVSNFVARASLFYAYSGLVISY